jgi:hypothetical protein
MKDDQHRFLGLVGQAPVRLTVDQAAWVINCQAHDIPVLVAAKLLRPLGNPQPNGTKYFSTAEILEQTKDRSWLAKTTNAISQHWRAKNARKAINSNTDSGDRASSLEFFAAHGAHRVSGQG